MSSHFPNVKLDTWTELWFFVYLKDYGSTTYVIVDNDLDLSTEIDLKVLEYCTLFPGDDDECYPINPMLWGWNGGSRFELDLIDTLDQKLLCIYNRLQGTESYLLWELAKWSQFLLGKWFAKRCLVNSYNGVPWVAAHDWMLSQCWSDTMIAGQRNHVSWLTNKLTNSNPCHDDDENEGGSDVDDGMPELVDLDLVDKDRNTAVNDVVPLHGVQVAQEKYVSVQRNAVHVKGGDNRLLPKPVVIQLKINDSPVQVLIDSESLGHIGKSHCSV